ncbi:MAG: hypothetical protein LBI72_11145 [Flavobacteriaceae bacterium]|jgi:hypothetical protein|nr:hypothetical protein [Flavobacteriaceae bacterium]
MNKYLRIINVVFCCVLLVNCNVKESNRSIERDVVEDTIVKLPKEDEKDSVTEGEEEWQFQQPPDIAFMGFDDVDKNVRLELGKELYDRVPASINITVINNSDWDISSESKYEISAYVENDWEPFDMNQVVLKDKPFIVKKGSNVEVTVDLFTTKFNYPKGRYRIIVFFEFEWAKFEHEVRFSIVE